MWRRPEFSELRPLTKIYVGLFVVVIWTAMVLLAGQFNLHMLSAGGVLFVVIGLAVVAAAASIEKFILRIAERKRQADDSDQSPN